MNNPLFSVVIPCFNASGTLVETIASVFDQTMQDFEILAVNNNSTDTTAEVLAELAHNEPRIQLLQQPVQGPSATRNMGIQNARGTYIAFLDSDDLWDRDYLEAHLANLSDGEVGVSYCRARLIDMASRPTGKVSQPKLDGLQPRDLLRSNPCTSTSFIVVPHRDFDDVGLFNEALHRAEDQDWLFRAAFAGIKLSGIDRTLASYRITPGSLSSDTDAMLAGHGQLLNAAEHVAPELIARERRLAEAAILRYCARRAMDHNTGEQTARNYLLRMLRQAPDLLLREPLATLKTIAAVLLPGMIALLPTRAGSLKTEDR